MASSRGAANAALYRARILLDAWDSAAIASSHSEDLLIEAFLPAVQGHLRDAYGWFLLAAAGIEDASRSQPPHAVADVPATEAGKAVAPELREFSRLEGEGWIGEMLSTYRSGPSGVLGRSTPGLLSSDREAPGPAVVRGWLDKLNATMQRMDDSLAEC